MLECRPEAVSALVAAVHPEYLRFAVPRNFSRLVGSPGGDSGVREV